MRPRLTRRRYVMLWQLALLIFGTSWLWAPLLNPGLSDRLSLISDYETAHQPYAWLFRLADAIAGLLVLAIAWLFFQSKQKPYGWLIAFIGVCFFLDSLLPTTCRMTGNICQGDTSARYFIHGSESVAAGTALFITMLYDSLKRKKLLSWSVTLVQIVYGIYFIVATTKGFRTHTIYQYVYETIAIAWLAWLGRDLLFEGRFTPRAEEFNLVRNLSAVWAFTNGVLAIVISLAHIQLVGRLRGLYFAGNNAWLGQHGVIIGVIMVYLSRHLARGELRARQIFLVIVGLETIKYAILTPNFSLLGLYFLTFVVVFIFRDDFDRGTVPMTWAIRLRDLYYMLAGLLLASGVALLLLDRDDRASIITNRAYNHFFNYVSRGGLAGHSHLRAVLLAQTVSVFLVAAAISVLWILFRPYKTTSRRSHADQLRAEQMLKQLSTSSEDYFKVWPHDKHYFWSKQLEGFVAYKIKGPAVFGLADPITLNKAEVLEQFMEWARGQRLKACFLPIYPASLKLYEAAGLQQMQIGASAVINIETFLTQTANDKWWRWQKNRALKKGYEFMVASPPHSPAFLRQLKQVSDNWLQVGGHSEYGFALGHFDTDYLNQCQVYYLKDSQGQVIAFTNQIPQFKPDKIITVDLLRYLPEFNNAMPYLLYKTIESAGQTAKYQSFDLGFVPFAKARGPILTIAKTLGGSRFSARGLEQFKNKFDPEWQPNYMAYDGDLGDLAMIALHLEQAMEVK